MRTFDKTDVVLAALGLATLLGFLTLTIPNPTQTIVAAICALPTIAWLINRRHFNATYLSPTLVACGFFALVGALGYALRDALSSLLGRGSSVNLRLSESQSLSTLTLLMVFAAITVLTSGLILRARSAAATETSQVSLSWEAREPKGLTVLLSAVPLLVIVWDMGLDQIMSRNSYLFASQGSFTGSIGTTLAAGRVVVLGYFFGSSKGGKRAFVFSLFVGYAMVIFSMGSRRLALIPILFAVGVFVARNTRKTRIGVVVGAALTAAVLPLSLTLRGSWMHGVIPYMDSVRNFQFANADWLAALNNVLVSFPIIGATAYGNASLTASDLWISLNPISGDSAGWYEIAPKLRLNAYTPMAGIGELANVGWTPVILFAVILGILLAWVEIAVRRHLVEGSRIFAALLIGLSGFFALQMVQYNLRSAVRMLVYLVAIEVGRRFIVFLFRQPRKSEREKAILVERLNRALHKNSLGARDVSGGTVLTERPNGYLRRGQVSLAREGSRHFW
jgi:hypothetical protein